MPEIRFVERSLSGGWTVEVRAMGLRRGRNGGKARPSLFVIGHIRRRPSGGFDYFPDSQNALTAALSDDDLETLKEKVRANPRR